MNIHISRIIWMFRSRGKNNKINRLHEKCLQIIYSDKESTFTELLERIILSQFIKETYVFFPLTCSDSKEAWHYVKE